jgi:histidinol dehydrogenase
MEQETPPRGDLAVIADDVAASRIALETAMDAEKSARAVYETYEAELFDALENAGIRQFRTGRGLFTQNDLAWAQVEDEEAARAWAEATAPELLLLNRQRLSVLVRAALKEGDDLPPGVTFTTSRKITWRRQ